jgi:hypothetical protein
MGEGREDEWVEKVRRGEQGKGRKRDKMKHRVKAGGRRGLID